MKNKTPINSYVAMIASEIYDSNDTPCLFSKNVTYKYKIPVYQRPYSWEENNIDDFLQTIMDGFNNNSEMKFFGTMQFNVNGNEEKEYEIVDGQQRLTTIILFAHVLELYSETNIINQYSLEINTGKDISNLDLKTALSTTAIEKIPVGKKGKIDLSNISNKYEANLRLLNDKFLNYYTDCDQKQFPTITKFAKDILDYFLKNLYVVVLETQAQDMRLPEIVNIFNTINTTGMDLNASDIFKLQYYDYLSHIDPTTGDKYMSKIDSCYEIIDQYNMNKPNKNKISFSWVLDIYKHCICAKYKLKYSELSKSNERFFDDLFKSPDTYNDLLKFSSFNKLVSLFIDFWTELENGNVCNDAFHALSVKLISESRYSRYWTVPFVYAFFNTPEEDFITPQDLPTIYSNALDCAFSVFRYFTVNSINYAKVINPVQSTMCNEILPRISCGEDISTYIDSIIWDSPYGNGINEVEPSKKTFISYLEKNTFASSKVGLLCLILAINSEIKVDANISRIKNLLFNWEDNPYDIEHIFSRKLFDDELNEDEKQYYNGLGNLVILERSINREMGSKNVFRPEGKDTYYQNTKFAAAIEVRPQLKSWNTQTVKSRNEGQINTLIKLLSTN